MKTWPRDDLVVCIARSLSLVILVALTFSLGCTRMTPAGFWTRYRPELIERQSSDQGPWGGTRWVIWSSQPDGTFRADGVLRFAESNGWSCGEPRKYTAEQLRLWQFDGQPVFPLHFGAGDGAPDDHAVTQFPRAIGGDSLVYECRTGWVQVEPGSGRSSNAPGYILLEVSGARMAVYHLWGEI